MDGPEKDSKENDLANTENTTKDRIADEEIMFVDLTSPASLKRMEGAVVDASPIITSNVLVKSKTTPLTTNDEVVSQNPSLHSSSSTSTISNDQQLILMEQPSESRVLGADAPSSPDAVRSAEETMPGNKAISLEVKPQITDTNAENPKSCLILSQENLGIESNDHDEAPEPPITSARRITPERRKLHKHHNSVSYEKAYFNLITPQSKDKIQAFPRNSPVSNELAFDQKIPDRLRWDAGREALKRKKPISLPDYDKPHDIGYSCPQPPPRRRGRSRPPPCSKEMFSPVFGFRPRNTLAGSSANSQPRPVREFSNTADKKEKAFNLHSRRDSDDGPPAKRQRTNRTHAGSSSTSPVILSDECESQSNTVHRELSPSQNSRTSERCKKARHLDNIVSGTSEFYVVENTVKHQSKPRRLKKKSSTEFSQPSKKQCSGINGASSNNSVSSGRREMSESTREISRDLSEDPIQSTSPQPSQHLQSWTGAGKPSKAPAHKVSKSSETAVEEESPYFVQDSSKSKLPITSSRANGVGASYVQDLEEIDDSSDELSRVQPQVPSKQEAARAKGDGIIANLGKKPASGDIPRTKFKGPKPDAKSSLSSNTGISEKVYKLSAYIVGSSHWELGENSDAWHWVPYLIPETGKVVFQPYKGDDLMANERSELVMDPENLTRITTSTNSNWLHIHRRPWGRQKNLVLSIKLAAEHELGFFLQMLHKLNNNLDHKEVESQKLKKMVDTLRSQTSKPAKSSFPESQEQNLLEARQHQRSLQSLQTNNKASSTPSGSTKTRSSGIFNKARYESPDISATHDAGKNRSSSNPVNARGGLRRSTRLSDHDQNFTNSIIRELSPDLPSWTKENLDWERRWGSRGTPLHYPPVGRNKAHVDIQDIVRLDEGTFLNDNLIAFYLRYLQERLQKSHPELVEKIYFHNSYFYASLTQSTSTKPGFSYDAVKKWTAKIDWFDKEYIIVPINESTHWYLAIIHNAPALKELKASALSQGTHASAPVPHENEEARRVENGDTASRKFSEQQDGVSEVKSDSDLPSIEKMSLESKQDPPSSSGHQDQDTSQGVQNGANSEEPVAEIPDSQPSSPKQGSPEVSSSPVINQDNEASLKASGHARIPSIETEHKTTRSSKTRKDLEPRISNDAGKITIFILDSLSIPHRPTITNLRNWMIAEANTQLGISVDKSAFKGMSPTARHIPTQENLCDCGVFLLAYTDYFLQIPIEFVQRLLNGKMTLDKWGGCKDASIMRNEIRNLIFQCKKVQEGVKKSNGLPTNNKGKSLESTSREASMPPNKSLRPSPDSPSEQLRYDQSRPSSSGSQNPKHRVHEEMRVVGVDRQNIKSAGKVISRDQMELTPPKKNPTTQPHSSEKRQAKANPISPKIDTSLPQATETPSPSWSSGQSSVALEPPIISSRDNQKLHEAPKGSREGSTSNPISVMDDAGDNVSPSSTLTAHETLDAIHVQDPRDNQVQVVIPVSRSEPVSNSNNASDLQKGSNSQDHMLLDEEEDSYLNHPKDPGAITDSLPISGGSMNLENPNGMSALATSLESGGGKSSHRTVPSPNPKGRPHKDKTYSVRELQRNKILPKKEVINLEEED